MTFGLTYGDRESTLRHKNDITIGDRSGKVYSLHDTDITVWEDGQVTARRSYYASNDPRKTFPNMSVSNGQISISIEDLTQEILSRISPLELAEGIVCDDEAREQLVDSLGNRYATPEFTDGDRRKWLVKVQAAVHSKALDGAIERLNRLEINGRSSSENYRWRSIEIGHYERLYEFALASCPNDEQVKLFTGHYRSPESLKKFLDENADPVVRESAGKEWRESREYWQKVLLERFAAPEEASE